MEMAVFAGVLEAEWRRLINTEDLIQVSEEKKVYLVIGLLLERMCVSPVSVYFSSNLLEITLHKYENYSTQQNLFSTC